jgi:hypothetical protein
MSMATHVTVAVSTGTLTSGLFTTVASGVGEQLQKIDFSAGGFANANITFGVAKVAGGDGLANVGYINSTGHDLGKVTVKGDLGQIDAGDATTATPGLKSLSVRSLGRLGLDTQGGGSLESDINGALGSLVVAGDVKDAFVNVTGGADGKIGSITIGGSLIGGSTTESGKILSEGDMGAIRVGHDIQGGSGNSSGIIQSFSRLAGVTVGGSLVGGSNSDSGEVRISGDLGAVKIGHDVQGGSGGNSGIIVSFGNLAGVSIGGSLLGGSNGGSGWILSGGDLGAVKIGHDLTGASITGGASLDSSGVIGSSGRISGVAIGGSIITGIDTSGGALTRNATVLAGNDIGSLAVKGSVIGHGNTANSDASLVVISARGRAVQGTTTDLAIGRITVGGRVEYANVLAGYDNNLAAVNGDAQIGAVTVGGDWIASSLVAGARNLGADNAVGGSGANADNVNYGDSHDSSIGAGNPDIIAKIASIFIGGQVLGTPNSSSTTDHYGFVAQQLGAIKVGGTTVALAAGASNDNHIVGETTDLNVHEV